MPDLSTVCDPGQDRWIYTGQRGSVVYTCTDNNVVFCRGHSAGPAQPSPAKHGEDFLQTRKLNEVRSYLQTKNKKKQESYVHEKVKREIRIQIPWFTQRSSGPEGEPSTLEAPRRHSTGSLWSSPSPYPHTGRRIGRRRMIA